MEEPGFSQYRLVSNKPRSRINEEYKCNYCQKFFKTKWDLNCHVNMHTDEKPFKY